jgi:hypothetical protein
MTNDAFNILCDPISSMNLLTGRHGFEKQALLRRRHYVVDDRVYLDVLPAISYQVERGVLQASVNLGFETPVALLEQSLSEILSVRQQVMVRT